MSQEQNYLEIKNFVQGFLLKTRVDLHYSLESASVLLEIDEKVLADYENGKKSPICKELLRILKKYQADLDDFAVELVLLQINHKLNSIK